MKFEKYILLTHEELLNSYKSRESGLKATLKYSSWFPIIASSDLAGIFADLTGDGHLQDDPKLRLDYTSKSTEELERFGSCVYQIFKVKGKIRKCTTNTYGTMNYGINCKPLGRVLKLMGVPAGPKVFIPFQIPRWIIKDKNMFSRYINRLFSCEGCVDVSSKAIELRMHKSENLLDEGIEFFKSIQSGLMHHFGIRSTKPFLGGFTLRKDGIKTISMRLKVKNKESVIKFSEFIGIEDPIKRAKLKCILNSYKQKAI
jgi:hypothetical protein